MPTQGNVRGTNQRVINKAKYVQATYGGRLIEHLGVHKNQGCTHGIQLVHWIHNYPEDVNLSYHVVPFPKNKEWEKMAMLFEYALADKLNPIIGHHNG